MGINLELVDTMMELRGSGALEGHRSVVELGAQVVSAAPAAVGARLGLSSAINTARELYATLGYEEYIAIDATGEHGSLPLDLNRELCAQGFAQQFDLVTNLGTLEHCFNQGTAFKNVHCLCRVGGIMIHCLPAQGLVNHGFYNYHPRLIAELAAANSYAIEQAFFTVDFKPQRYPYRLNSYRAHDTRDVMIYAVLRRTTGAAFAIPFDGMFADQQRLGYDPSVGQASTLAGEFTPYIKTSWDNVLGD